MARLTNILILLNVIVFLLVFSMPEVLLNSAFDSYSFSGARALEIWRWITALFLHASASHLFFNMLGLYIFGSVLEREVNQKWFLAIYFGSGLIGNLAFMFTSAGSAVGASGSVFGLLGAAMFLKPTEKIHLYIFPLPLSIIAILFVISETFVLYFQPKGFANVATISHVAGILTGSLFAFFHSPKKAVKGFFILALSAVIIIILSPILALITAIGGFILSGMDFVIGIVLYSLASLLSFLWV